MIYDTVFSPAEILLPKFCGDAVLMNKWAVIACDQFTSEPEYWERCERHIGNGMSAYKFIVPEAYLGTEREERQNAVALESMRSFDGNDFTAVNGLVYVVRTLPSGEVRRGIVGKIDLERYDYSVGSSSAVRATEKTVVERIPPRCKIRASATIELPHVLVLTDDKRALCELAESLVKDSDKVYDFELMESGGHITGYSLTGGVLDTLMDEIGAYERTRGSLVYAVGDGNHSLAAAKAHWESIKADGADMSHPARYALCEITSISDESLVFEPIYRVLKNCDTDDVLATLAKVTSDAGDERITVISSRGFTETYFSTPTHALTVGTLQNFIDDYISSHPSVVCDYIHGESTLIRLSMEENCVGFLFDGMSKGELFPYVEENGTLPRKTFSMGEAESKRFYLEARKIVK